MSKFTVLKDAILPWKNENGSTGTRKLKAGSSISGDASELKVYVDLHILAPIFEPVATNRPPKAPKAEPPKDELPEEPVVVDDTPEPETEPESEPEEPKQNLPQTMNDLKAMNKETLVMLAKQLRAETTGSKAQLINRLAPLLFE